MKPIQPLTASEKRAREQLDLLSQVEQIGKLAPEERRAANGMLFELLRDICKPPTT